MIRSETFSLQLGLAAPVAELEAWLADAAPLARAIYASGFDFPREADGVRLVAKWQAAGLVALTSARDRLDARKTNWLVEKSATGGGTIAPNHAQRVQLDLLLAMLRDCAVLRRPCPSNSAIARELVLGGSERGRGRAQYLLMQLAREGKISVESGGRNAARVVTIHARGRGAGRQTRRAEVKA